MFVDFTYSELLLQGKVNIYNDIVYTYFETIAVQLYQSSVTTQ